MSARLTGGPTLGWRPPPECPVCGRAVKRAAYEANGGTCSDCRGVLEDRDVVPADPEALDLLEWQRLAAVRGRDERQRQESRRARRRAPRAR